MKFTDTIALDSQKQSAEARVFVSPDAEFLTDHFPENPMLPALLMLEAAVRAASELWRARCAEEVVNSARKSSQTDFASPEFARLARVERLSVVRRVVPGEILKVQVELVADEATKDNNSSALFSARAVVNNENAMRSRFQLRRETPA